MMRALLLVLLMLAVSGIAAHAQNALSPEQERAVRDVLRQELKEHPELVLDAIRQLQARDRQANEDRHRDLIRLHEDEMAADSEDFVAGNPKGDVTLVEFFDYRCPYCKAMAEPLQALVKKDGKLRLVLKEFPILGPNSTLASKASIGARPQGRYLAFHEALLTHRGDLDDKAITAIARGLGIDTGKMKARAEDPQVTAKLARNLDLGRALELDGTPAFIIGDTLIPGAVDLEMLEQAIAEARNKS
jgi:protein-disulfide isomerase